MAIKTIRVCDRCGKYIEYRGWTARIKGLRFRKIFMRKIFNGNPDGCSYSDWHIELCAEVNGIPVVPRLEKLLRNLIPVRSSLIPF